MTTRRHYPGRHRVELLARGVAFLLGEFAVRSRATHVVAETNFTGATHLTIGAGSS